MGRNAQQTGKVIIERCHESIKMAAKKQCSIQETFYYQKVIPRNDISNLCMPANKVKSYKVQLKVIDTIPLSRPAIKHEIYQLGNLVWIKTFQNQCPLSNSEAGK